MIIRAYLYRVLLILTYTFLAVLWFGILGQSFLSTTLGYIEIIAGASVVTSFRKVIASYDIKELLGICFSFAFIDWLLYTSNTQFKLNIKDNFKRASELRYHLWE